MIRVAHQPGRYDEFRHHYRYDHASRLVSVSTSRDSVIWDEDARYEYYPHGPLRRFELGQDSVQGIDYTYTIHGWLKGINTPSLDSALDVGLDGHVGGKHEAFAKDAFGMILGYHTGDFVRSGSQFASGASWTYAGHSLYNGNIGTWTWNTRQADGTPLHAMAATYRYDVLNRIKYDSLSVRGLGAWGTLANTYGTTYNYDPNGNILSLTRRDSSGTLFDDLTYNYLGIGNKLSGVDDAVAAGVHPTDIDDQIGSSFYYDATGNFVGDEDQIEKIIWTPSNKIDSIMKQGDTVAISYLYDAMGNRVLKRVYDGAGATMLRSTTWYARDAHGNTMAIYTQVRDTGAITASELHMYGSDRLGLIRAQAPYTEPDTTIRTMFHRTVALKAYEMKEHLGNVRATVSDVVTDLGSGLVPVVHSRTDYYPFGMMMAERHEEAEASHRYGFNGKENDNEVKGEGVQQDYGFRIYDARIARFLSVDPLTTSYPSWSPYPFAMNRVIDGVDIDGREWGESTIDIGGRAKQINRWVYAKVTRKYPKRGTGRGNFSLDDARMWNILNKTREYLAQAMSTGDNATTDYQMRPEDAKFVHHRDGSNQANQNLDIVIQFESAVFEPSVGYVSGANYDRGNTESGLIRIALGMKLSDGSYFAFKDEQIASTIAHELLHSGGLGDANVTQRTEEDERINRCVPQGSPNLMNQKRTRLQGPFLTTEQQEKVSRTIELNKPLREQMQQGRKDRNDAKTP